MRPAWPSSAKYSTAQYDLVSQWTPGGKLSEATVKADWRMDRRVSRKLEQQPCDEATWRIGNGERDATPLLVLRRDSSVPLSTWHVLGRC
jgi:hypothetical protein